MVKAVVKVRPNQFAVVAPEVRAVLPAPEGKNQSGYGLRLESVTGRDQDRFQADIFVWDRCKRSGILSRRDA